MRKLKAEFEWYNDKQIAIELEQISQLIMDNQTEGENWQITGEEETEPRDPIEEVEKEADFPINFNEE